MARAPTQAITECGQATCPNKRIAGTGAALITAFGEVPQPISGIETGKCECHLAPLIKIKSMKAPLKLLAVAALLLWASCKKDNNHSKRLLGDVVTLEHGSFRSFIDVDKNNTPTAIGFLMSEAVFHHLPHHDTSFLLHLPAGNNTIVNHIGLDYSAHGHTESPVYGFPHFDMHFYNISPSERALIDAASPEIEKLPAPQFIPQDYVPTPSNVSNMGKHWLDTTAAELHGQPFTQTMVRGTYNGAFIFYEPMITIAYLQTKPNATFAIKQAQKVSNPGLHPTKYSVRYDGATAMYIISLEGLKQQFH